MADVIFTNTYFDPEIIEFSQIAEGLAKSVGSGAELSIDPQLAELLRLRVSQLNPCPYCLILHTEAAHGHGISPEKIAHLPGWRRSTMYTKPEMAALAYCEALTSYDYANFNVLHNNLTAYFDEKGIAEIAAVIINMTLWTRLKLAQGQVPVVHN